MAIMGKYMYCFINERDCANFGRSQIGGLNAPVHTITYGDVSAVVSEAPILDYDPTRKNLMAHQEVILKVMGKYTVLPVAFGTVARNKNDVTAVINANHNQFLKNISYLKDKVELGLRVTWNKDYFNIDIEDEAIKLLKNKISGRPEKEVFTEKIQLGKMVEASIGNKREEYTMKIYKPLEMLAAESKQKITVPIKTVFNAYFLVEKVKEASFDSDVEKLRQQYEGKLTFYYTGPWPPYNFINMKLELINANK